MNVLQKWRSKRPPKSECRKTNPLKTPAMNATKCHTAPCTLPNPTMPYGPPPHERTPHCYTATSHAENKSQNECIISAVAIQTLQPSQPHRVHVTLSTSSCMSHESERRDYLEASRITGERAQIDN